MFHFITGVKKSGQQKLIKMYIIDSNNKHLPFIKGMFSVILF